MVGAQAPATSAAKVCAVVVTHNRSELLRRCLTALAGQERPPDATLVVDNASSDGTAAMLGAEFAGVEVLSLAQNIGGAGGFHRGMAWAYERGYDWLWLMDDDTLAQTDSLARLLDAAQATNARLFASQVLWQDERLHPMNTPVVRWRSRGAVATGAALGLVAIRYTTFVSVLLHREMIAQFGLPQERFFIWGDDVEYTARVLREQQGYLVPGSRVNHWTATPHPPATPTSDRFYYHARNSLWILRSNCFSVLERIDYARYYLRTVAAYLRVNRGSGRRLALLARGVRDGLRP
jgi:GT2 family glycosyltransferase